MEERYYLVKEKGRPMGQKKANFVFIKISKGELENLAGDESIFSLLELKDGKPKIKENTKDEYEIQPLTNNIYLGVNSKWN